MEKQIKEILENIENIRKEIKGMKLSYNISFIAIGIWILVLTFLLIALNGCTGPEFGYFMEGLAQGLADEENVSSSEPAGDPGVQESTASERASGLCRTSPAGQKVCSSVGSLSNENLVDIDAAWIITLACVRHIDPNIAIEKLMNPLPGGIIFVSYAYLQNLLSYEDRAKGAKLGGRYDPETKTIVISPETFSSIYHEYGHYIDDLIGNTYQSCRHAISSFAVKCSTTPIDDWLNQAASLPWTKKMDCF